MGLLRDYSSAKKDSTDHVFCVSLHTKTDSSPGVDFAPDRIKGMTRRGFGGVVVVDTGRKHTGVKESLQTVTANVAGDSVIIVNAIHLHFPGHTWVRLVQQSLWSQPFSLVSCQDTKIYRFMRNRRLTK